MTLHNNQQQEPWHGRDTYLQKSIQVRTSVAETKPKPSRVNLLYSNGYCTALVKAYREDINWKGNANTYLSQAKAEGMEISQVPEEGAVIQTKESRWGHVAIVEEVNEDTITIVEQNVKGYGVVSRRTLNKNDKRILGYIL